ncbi:MAG: hypothetical protein PHY66_05950, partial [Aliarcobacter sp.]|nr:hypothetical protein [Aliarcobacter sp.]
MAEITNILKDENTNNPQEDVQTTPNEPNIELQKDTQQFLQKIDSIINIPNQPANQQKNTANENNVTNPINQSNNNSDTQNTTDLKVRIVKKNSLDGDVNAGLRNPISDTTQVRVVEKNNLQTDVIASLRDPVTDYRGNEEVKVFSAIQVQTPTIIKPNMTISSAIVEEGTKAVFNVHFDKASNKIYNVSFNLSTNGTAQDEDINTIFIVKDSKGNEISKNPDGTYSVPLGETNLKVEVQTRNDNNFEGNETFELNGKTEFMNSNIQGIGTIVDDDTLSNGLNDDRPLSVSSVTVNEASPYAVFTVSGAAGQLTSLNLANQNNDGSDLSSLEYFNGTSWINYTSGNVTLDSNGKLLVRIALNPEQDTIFEGEETFNLVATNTSGISASGLGTIVDDGTGSYFAQNNNTGTSNVPNGVVLDNDKPQMTIGNVTVEEGCGATFTVTVGQTVAPYKVTFNTTVNGSAETNDITTPLVVKAGNTVITVNQDGSYTVPAGTTSLTVTVPTVNDNIYEGSETFELNGKTEFMTSEVSGTGTIKDDGTASDGDDNDSLSDNDKPTLTLSDATIEEGSTIIFAG